MIQQEKALSSYSVGIVEVMQHSDGKALRENLIINSVVGAGISTASDRTDHSISIPHCRCERAAVRAHTVLSAATFKMGSHFRTPDVCQTCIRYASHVGRALVEPPR